MTRENKRNLFLIISVFVLAFLLLEPLGAFNQWIPQRAHRGYYSITRIDTADDTYWYSYLRSMFIDRNIDFWDERGFRGAGGVSATGYTPSYVYCIGNSLAWLPYFFTAHALTAIFNYFGCSIPLDGYSYPYLSFTGIGSAVNGLIGGMALYLVLVRRFSGRAALITTIITLIGSHLPFFLFIRSRLSHANDFFTVCVFILLVDSMRNIDAPKYLKPVVTGLWGGLMAAVRMNNAPIAVFYLWFLVADALKRRSEGETGVLKETVVSALIFAGSFSVLLSLPFIAANVLQGSPFILYQPADPGQAAASFLAQMKGIFSHFSLFDLFFRHDFGLIYSAPALALGIVALPFYARRNFSDGFGFILAFLPVLAVLVLLSRQGQGGTEYGIRQLIAGYPMIAVGLCFLVHRTLNRWRRSGPILFSVAFILVLWQYLQLVQYKIFFEYFQTDATFVAFENIFGRLWQFPHYLLRSTCWAKVVFLMDPRLDTFKDIFFLVLVPLSVILFSFLSYFMFVFLQSASRAPMIKKHGLGLALLLVFIFSLPPLALYAWNRDLPLDTVEKRVLVNLRKAGVASTEEEAIKFLKRVERVVPDHSKRYLLSRWALEEGLWDKSIEYAQRAVDMGDPRSRNLRSMGVSYHQKGRLNTALKLFNEICAADPTDLEARFISAMIMYEMGDLPIARNSLLELKKKVKDPALKKGVESLLDRIG